MNQITVYETISSLNGSLYCGYSQDEANDAFIERHAEIIASGFSIIDNIALYANDEPVRVYYGGAASVEEKRKEITSQRIADAKATFEAEQRLIPNGGMRIPNHA